MIYDENHISHRGRHRRRLHRGRPGALRGLRLAHPARRLDQHRRIRRRRAGTLRGAARREGRNRQAVDHFAADHHRLPGAEEAEHRQDPRLRPGRRGSRGAEEASSASTRSVPSRSTRTSWPTPATSWTAAPTPARTGREPSTAWQAANPEGAALLERVEAQQAPGRTGRRPAGLRGRQGRLHPRRVRQGPERDRPGHARTLGRLRRPGRVQQHHDRRLALVHPGLPAPPRRGRATPTAGSCTSASASTPPRRS